MTTTVQDPTTEELLTRLHRIEGQIRGLQHMLGRGDTCVAVLTQIAAARAALAAVGRGVLACEIRRALVAGADDADRCVDDILAAVERYASRW